MTDDLERRGEDGRRERGREGIRVGEGERERGRGREGEGEGEGEGERERGERRGKIKQIHSTGMVNLM